MKHSPYIIIAFLLLMACTPQVPSKYIQPSDMEDILYDYYVSQAMAKNGNSGADNDMEKNRNFLAVLRKYKVSEADFDSSLVYYYSHLDRLKRIYTEVNERLADEAKELGAAVGEIGRYSQYSATGDTANIWADATDLLLMPKPTMNRFDFTVRVDTSFYQGDSFMFQFMTDYLWQNGTKDAVVCLVTKYEGDSIIQTVNHVSTAGLSQIRIPANRENKLKEMRGFIYLGRGNDYQDQTRKMMFIRQIQLIRFHNKAIQNETKQDSITTDSVPRGVNPRRPLPDSASAGNLTRLRAPALSAEPRAGQHRMAAGPDRAEKR